MLDSLWLASLGLSLVLAALFLQFHVRKRDPTASEASELHGHSPFTKSLSVYQSGKEAGVDANYVPDPKPLLDFDLKTARTRDYLYVNKTVRFPYYQTMAHQPMEIENWIEISSSYEWYLAEKKRVIEEKGPIVLDSLPENDFACQELLETVVDWLPKRYPTMFDRLLTGTSESNPYPLSDGSSHHYSGSTEPKAAYDGIFNRVTNERYEWEVGNAPGGKDALLIISRLTECDFLMALERDDGHVYFTGGLVAFPGFYLLSEKIGQSMQETHDPVPQFNQKLLMSVERTLKRMTPSAPFERSSWSIIDDDKLFWHNIADLKPGEQVSVKPEDLYLRIDRQAFRKLPKSRAIIFAVHPLIRQLRTLENSPLLPALLYKVHTESPKDLIAYKETWKYWEVLRPWLEEKTRVQIEKGLIGEGDLEKVGDFRMWAQEERV